MNVGLFGGTFNPIHNGHIQIIQYVKQHYFLDIVYFIPSATPPHKPDIHLAPASARYDMVQKSIQGFKGFKISDIELNRKGPSFTIDTIDAFLQTSVPQTSHYFIIGSDAFLEIGTWKQYLRILEKIPVIIMLRAGQEKSLKKIAAYIDNTLSAGYQLSEDRNFFYHDQKKPIYICNTPEIAISSTDVRERIQKKLSIHHLVPEDVENMIIEKGLYL